MRSSIAAVVSIACLASASWAQDDVDEEEEDKIERSIAGSVQLDYLAVPTESPARNLGLDSTTVELSLKMAVDFNDHASASVKMCYACHGLEVGMAFVDLRYKDELGVRIGRFTPSFGNFPIRHDPANHRTSDKPLPYDMGRMLRLQEWNMSVLPAPWVDNGVEVGGTHFFGESGSRIDYAVYAISGPKANANDADFNFVESRSRERYYADNNSEPTIGGRFSASFDLGEDGSLSAGLSGMAGHYDPAAELGFAMVGADLVLQYMGSFLRMEYLVRGTEMPTDGDLTARFKYAVDDDGEFDDIFIKDGFYVEAQVPVGRVDFIARWDGMRRFGNVLANSPLRSKSLVLRYTGGLAVELFSGIRVKTSLEVYDFSDFEDELAVHLGLATPF